jgi:acetylornithine deacetylase/succinyl-diaminopimelate desuccinylase-like protein
MQGAEGGFRAKRRFAAGDGREDGVEVVGIDEAVVEAVERETSELLSQLIRIDTSNPPGDETRVAEFMDAWFRRHGLEGVIVGEPVNRRSFVLRIDGERPGPTMLLLAHTDVVPAEPEAWSVPPFEGVIRDDYVWGRGAADIKNLVAAWAVAFRRVAAAGRDFAGTLLYAATADEEEGAVAGARWLTLERPDLVRCDYLLNEGGGEFQEIDGKRLYELHTGEKGTAQFRLTVHGEAGHASVPMRHGNAVVASAEIVRRLHDFRPPVRLDNVPRVYVETMVADADLRARLLDEATAREALDALYERDPRLAQLLEPHYCLTFAPTIVHSSSEAVNVFPMKVELSVDCRTLAGHGEDEVEGLVADLLDGVDCAWDLEWISVVRGNASPAGTKLAAGIERVLGRLVPGSVVVPMHSVGFTDSNWFRVAFPEATVYNFSPYLVDDTNAVSPRYHGVDEKIHVRDLAFQSLFAEQLVREMLV